MALEAGIESIIVPAVSAAGGGLTVGWVAKLLIQSWFKQHESMKNDVKALVISMTKMEVKVENLTSSEKETREQGMLLAVLQSQVSEVKAGLNGLGNKVRGLEQHR